jgi:mono/diheme cytochrome c family protein
MPTTITPQSITTATTAAAALTAFLAGPLLTPAPAQLLLVLESNASSESIPASNIVLHVPANAAPSPFLSPGPFTATWTGSLNLDLRSDFRFRADHAGAFTLRINGSNVLETAHAPGTTNWSTPVRLRKGTNTLTATLTRTNDTPAHIRLSWQSRTTPPSPIPPHLLTPPPSTTSPAPSQSLARHGRHLFVSLRCATCHTPGVPQPIPDLAPPAPSLTSLGSRRSPEWIKRWITNPHAHRPSATMPRTLRGPDAPASTTLIADWLSSLKQPEIPTPNPPQGVPAVGQSLFADLLCHTCHTLAGEPETPDRISLAGIPAKYPSPGALFDELRFPHRFDPWRRMPDFSLNPEEAAHLAAFLLPQPAPHTAQPTPEPLHADQAREAHSLAIRHGCFQCHPDPAPTPTPVTPAYQAPATSRLASAHPATGCIADTEPPQTEASRPFPWYPLQPTDRQALRAFLATDPDLSSLGRHVPTDFAKRWSRELRCQSCHDEVDGLPSISLAGEKLRPEWLHRLLQGEIGYKPRPWLPHRMPAFSAFAQHLAEGLAASAGLPPVSPPEPPPDPEAAAVGRKLVAASAGFACVTCHAIGPFQASAVFEAPGINLAHTADRLLPDFFIRWVRNPQAIDPTTKMPLYFDEAGNSALADYYDGDGPRTLNALWQYLRQGPSIVPPDP